MNVYDGTPEGAVGKTAEQLVRRDYLRRGCYVLDAYALRGPGAPLLTGPDSRRLRLPDLQVAAGGIPRWVEIKFKTRPVKYQKAKQWRTGIDLPPWRDYLEVERITGIRGWLAMIHWRRGPDCPPDPHLLEAPFSLLRQRGVIDERPLPHAPGGMIYWPTEIFAAQPLGLDVSGRRLRLPNLTKTVHPWERTARSGAAPHMDLAGEGPEQLALPPWGDP